MYTFCMCPGGQVVASASETGHVVTNGMSYHARDGKNANAAVVVSVGAEDFAGDPRRAIAFQRELEAKAYAAGRRGGAYAAPAENVQSFLEGKGQLNIGRVEPTYDRGVVAADLGALLPGELADTLRAGLRAYERKIAGYTAPEAILTGLETVDALQLQQLHQLGLLDVLSQTDAAYILPDADAVLLDFLFHGLINSILPF